MGLEVLFKKYGKKYKKNEVICSEKDTDKVMYIILEGTALVYKDVRRPKREKKVLAQLKSGDFFGEMSLLEGMPRFATVAALADIKVLVINMQILEKVVESTPDFAIMMMAKLAKRLRKTSAFKR